MNGDQSRCEEWIFDLIKVGNGWARAESDGKTTEIHQCFREIM